MDITYGTHDIEKVDEIFWIRQGNIRWIKYILRYVKTYYAIKIKGGKLNGNKR
jgi:hypothetical protein